MKVFMVGDSRTGTGPANVTKEYISNFPVTDKIIYQKMVSKVMRVPELILKTALCDVVIFSGYSRQNLLGIKLAGIFKKPTAYLMHGCVEHENAINGVPDDKMSECERMTMSGVDKIYAVSERFATWLKEEYPEYTEKISFVTNGVELPKTDNCVGTNKSSKTVFSIGGGMPRKKIKHICEAVSILRNSGMDVELVVAGDTGLDSDVINSYSWVINLGIVDSAKIRELFAKSDLFVQNSCFETFGLAPVEALANGCSVLLSNAVGALDIIGSIEDSDIIFNYNDPEEIAEKIKYLFENSNQERLLNGIDFNRYSWENRGIELCRKLRELLEK